MSAYDIGRFSKAHELVIDSVPAGSSVLEMGANTGYMSERLRQKDCRVTATEYDRSCLNRLSARADEAYWCDLNEWDSVDAVVGGRRFDVVVYADVLEHLMNPADVLSDTKKVLKPHGLVVVSMPNVAFYAVRFDLLRGNFSRPETGILDHTHLHFFTALTAVELFGRAGYSVDEFRIAEDVPFDTKLQKWTRGSSRVSAWKVAVNGAVARRWPGLFGYQFVWVLRPRTDESAR